MSNKDIRGRSRRNFLKLAAATTAAFTFDYAGLEALAAQIGSKQKVPVVVIGGGLGGLSAAGYLAKSGFPVTLIEQHDKPGGYATSFERAGGTYEFDVSLHATSGAETGLRAALEASGILDKVKTVELPDLCRIISPGVDIVWPTRDPDGIVSGLIELFPAEEAGIRGFFDEILGLLDEAMKAFDRSSPAERMQFPVTHPKMWAIRDQTLSDVLDRFTQDQKLRSILSSFWGYYGLPPSQISGFYYCIATASYIRFGGHYVRDRSQDLSDAFRNAIEANGGTVLLGTEATGITMENGAISGVVLTDGKTLEAKAVISNASVPATMKMLPEDVVNAESSASYINKLKSYKPSISTFLVWLGLKGDIREKIKDYEIFMNHGFDPEEDFKAALACDPSQGSVGITVYDNAFEGYSKPGTSTVSLITISGYEPWKRFEQDYFAGRKTEYLKEKERITKMMIAEAEKIIPGLSSMIEVIESATPLTNVFYTKNPQGAIYGYEQSLANSYMTRLPNTTPFKGLYLASAWCNPGGGYQPCLGSGVQAVSALLNDLSE